MNGIKPVLLIDFGSTYTKVTAADVDGGRILGTAQSHTTVGTDIIEGFSNAAAILKEETGDLEFSEQYACSSAAGGLRMIAIGLVPELTAKAARQASLGAGAKVIKTYSYELTEGDIREIDGIDPDICLLTGGTDGGNKENIIFNAGMLAKVKGGFPVIIAGNRSCADECREILREKEAYVCENVMPRVNIPNTGPVQQKIRTIFLERIVKAKGLSKAQELIGGILMPTPSAMLAAMKLLAKGTKTEAGLGDLLGIDLGGATTDVYSMSLGLPEKGMTVIRGLREEYAKRTVEGDIGMRYGVKGIVEAAGIGRVSELSGLDSELCSILTDRLAEHTDVIPSGDRNLEAIDFALASLAVETAVTRHAGHLEQFYSPMGENYLQTGKDLTGIRKIILTGGALIHAKNAALIASHALFNPADPFSLKPVSAEIFTDKKYILAAMGLLGEKYPDTALRIMKEELAKNGAY